MIKIAVERRQSVVEETEIITTGSVGIEVKFNFNSDWDGLSRVAVFRVGDKEDWYDIMLDETNTCVIPWELLTVENEGDPVFVGAEGTLTDGTVVIPTVWVSVGAIKPGAHSGNASGADPTPTQWSQIRNLAEAAAVSASNAEDYAEDAHETAEAAQEIVSEFEGFTATATTLAAGSDATASYSDGVLSLGIPQGQKGEDGTSGEDGDDGVTFTPSVSSAGVISWTNDGDKPNPDPVDIMGPMGPPGVAVDDDAPTHGELVWIETDNSQTIVLPEVDDTTASNNNTYSSNKIESIKSGIENTLNQLDQNMAYVESGNTASRTYAAGDFISWKGTLYKTSTAIPQGDPFAVGTNLAPVVDGNGDLCGGFNALPKVINNFTSTSSVDALSANCGNILNTKLTTNIVGTSKTDFENKLTSLVNSMSNGETRVGYISPDYYGSMTGGAKSGGMITKLGTGVAVAFLVSSLVFGYYYSSAWHWYKPTLNPIT